MTGFYRHPFTKVIAIGGVLLASAALAWTAVAHRSAETSVADPAPEHQATTRSELSLDGSLTWTLGLLNGGLATEAEIAARVTPEVLQALPPRALKAKAAQLARLGPFTRVGYTRPPTEHQATVLLTGANGLQFVLPITVESASPHRISDLTFIAMPAASTLRAFNEASETGRFDGLVEIGGREVFLSCSGTGSPTVILESGLGESAAGWFATQTAVSKFTRVCSYDRPNTTASASDRIQAPRTGEDVSGDLATLLAIAGESGPYVLVGHSIGGQFVRIFAAQHPGEVAGLVLIDSTHEDEDADRQGFATSAAFANLQKMMQANSEGIDLRLTAAQVRRARTDSPLGDLALVVVAAGLVDPANFMPGWPMEEESRSHNRLQAELATLSSSGELVVAQASVHHVHQIESALVLNAILRVVSAGRSPD